MPSPWYVHPFEAHERGATLDLRFYSRNLGDAARAELYSDVLWKLYGDYFRHSPNEEGKKRTWFCPALDQTVKVEGTPNAYNATAWVETDAVNSMLYYLSSGDFFRMCNDQSRELELNTAGMGDAAAREELHRASNVLTSYYDIQVDGTLRDAIRAHLNDRDHRWLMVGG